MVKMNATMTAEPKKSKDQYTLPELADQYTLPELADQYTLPDLTR